jgi:hypothetical protein
MSHSGAPKSAASKVRKIAWPRGSVKSRLISLAALALVPTQPAWAQTPDPSIIVLREPPVSPATEIVSVQTLCGSRTFKFTITNQVLGPSVLSEALRDGHPPQNPESTNALREFLASVRNVHITGSHCYSEDEIGLSLYGLLRAPPPGQRDDAVRTFQIRFGQPARGLRRQSQRHEPQDVFPPWEGSGVYAFGPLLLDLNHRRERWGPGRSSPLVDCSNDEVYCLTARRGNDFGVVAFAVPRLCGNPAVGDRWSSAEVRTVVLARIEPSNEPIRNPVDYHTRRTATVYYLGDDANPEIVYEYFLGNGIVAVLNGLIRYPDLVDRVRRGMDPTSLPPQHRYELSTFDRLAQCRQPGR